MRVAIISPGELFGGVERQIIDLLTTFKAMEGIEAFGILFHDRRLAAELRERGFRPSIVKSCCAHDPRVPRRLRHVLRELGIDLLHVHGYKSTVTAMLAGEHLPTVKTVHGLPEPPRSAWQAIKSRGNLALDTWATRRLRAIVCYVTEEVGSHFEAAHRGMVTHVIHNGIVPIDGSGIPRPADLSRAGFHVGIVGRLGRVKGIAHAIKAMTLPEMPEAVVLDVFGEGPEKPALKAQAMASGLSQRVRFHGFRNRIHEYLAHLDCLLMPSLHEGLPYTLLEAMSLGRPIVASRVGGLAEVLQDGRTGLLVEVGDARSIARAVARLVDDPALAGRLGAAAAREQRERFTLESMAQRYREVYVQALSGGVIRGGSTAAPGRGR